MRVSSFIAVSCALIVGGCAIGPSYKRPDVATPERYKEGAPPGDATAGNTAAASVGAAAAAADAPAGDAQPIADWWTLFNDPVLNDLESQVVVSNQNLAASAAAYRQALAAVREQRAMFFPAITASAGATRAGGEGRTRTTTVGETGTVTTRGPETYQAEVSASWEIDLWGRLRRALENARATADASAADLAFARLSMQGQLASAYLQLREADTERRLLADTASAYERSLQIAENRYNVGAAPKTDLLQAQTQFANARDQEAALILQRAQLEHAIAALVGKPAGDFSLAAAESWQGAVPRVPVGIPSTLLRRRPDIASAERRVAAANASIGIEEADYFPSLTLTGAYDFVSAAASTLFKSASETHTVGASLGASIFNGGATRARVAGARAAYDQFVAEYRQTVLTAFQDVEDELASSRILERQYELRRQASAAADETERLTMNQYRAGTVSYTNVVVAQTAALSARRALAEIALSRQTTAVALVTALGGGWQGLEPR